MFDVMVSYKNKKGYAFPLNLLNLIIKEGIFKNNTKNRQPAKEDHQTILRVRKPKKYIFGPSPHSFLVTLMTREMCHEPTLGFYERVFAVS